MLTTGSSGRLTRVHTTDPIGDRALVLEAYATGSRTDSLLAILRSLAAADDTLRIIGVVAVPEDELVMCLFADGSEAGVHAFAARGGLTTIRIVPARWMGWAERARTEQASGADLDSYPIEKETDP